MEQSSSQRNPDSTCFTTESLLHSDPSLLQLPLLLLHLFQLPLDNLWENKAVEASNFVSCLLAFRRTINYTNTEREKQLK